MALKCANGCEFNEHPAQMGDNAEIMEWWIGTGEPATLK